MGKNSGEDFNRTVDVRLLDRIAIESALFKQWLKNMQIEKIFCIIMLKRRREIEEEEKSSRDLKNPGASPRHHHRQTSVNHRRTIIGPSSVFGSLSPADYGPSDHRRPTTIFPTSVACRLWSLRPPSPTIVLSTTFTDYSLFDLPRLSTMIFRPSSPDCNHSDLRHPLTTILPTIVAQLQFL
ncbi:hypothetical protein IEQ34_015877 [Dendrobium chrysotoxum]|uniref:Uncharacterized protein n=1 Tax=Dendrobium chrysotoxum TaxID=161865 RepID=A0AAV7GI15_DENCH|nr:hypothetical protein IEQ34_015877 [Dendrobium chrysotoxum]